MGEVTATAAAAAAAFGRSRRLPAVFGGCIGGGDCNSKLKQARKWKKGMIVAAHSPNAAAGEKPPIGLVTFSSKISTEVPIYEPPGVSFDDYLSDRPRIFRAMFPDKRRSQQLNHDEWRIEMLPIQFLFTSVNPMVVMRLRCKSDGRGYPSGTPLHIPRILELQATRWELRGLESALVPTHFGLGVKGVLYSERLKTGTRLNGNLQLSISLVLPPLLALVPSEVTRRVAESVLKRLVEKMKQEVNSGLIADFRKFGREELMKHEGTAKALGSSAMDRRGDQLKPRESKLIDVLRSEN